jgi:predicted GNAT family acetyltransferase
VDAVAERLGVAGRPRPAEGAERLHRLDDLQPPRRKVAGAARRAGARDVGLVAQWYAQFFAEAFGHPLEDADASARHMLDGGGAVVLWEHGGEALSLAAARAPVFGVARIGPVYTPPDLRGRGYGSAVTAAATRLLLDAGAVPVLYTDLANPTSNAIYRALGYRPVCDWAMARFD